MKKGQSGNPGGRHSKRKLPALLSDALSETVFVTIDAKRRQITRRKAIVHQPVNKSTTADLRATKMLFDLMKKAAQKAGVAAPAPEPPPFTAADEEMVEHLIERIHHQVQSEMADKKRSSGRRDRRALMTDDELVEELHELKRRNQTPIPLDEMFDALLSRPQAGRKPAAHEILRDRGCAARTDRRLQPRSEHRLPPGADEHEPTPAMSEPVAAALQFAQKTACTRGPDLLGAQPKAINWPDHQQQTDCLRNP